MAPSCSKYTPRKRLNNLSTHQDVEYTPMQLLPVMNLSRFDPESTKLHALQERLKAAREDSHALTIQAANIEHQLFREWDSLSLASDAARDRHNETAMGYKEWYREIRTMHKRRIQQLEMEIQQESDYMNWREWSPVELLIRWKSGNMNYSIFKDHEATYRVQEAFRLEAGLEPPKLKMIAMVSAQVAAGWYKSPTESIDWQARTPLPGYVDEELDQDEQCATSTCLPTHGRDDGFALRGKSEKIYGGVQAVQDIPWSIPRPNVEQLGWDGPQSSTQDYKQKVESWNWDMRSNCDSFNAIEVQDHGGQGCIHIQPYQATEMDLDHGLDGDDFSVTGNHSEADPSWIHKYPDYHYSQEELDDIAAKAYAPDKPRKIVPMIAGRPLSKPILADEYVS